MPKDIVAGKINLSTIARIPEQMAVALARHVLSPGNIVFPRRGEINKCAFVTEREQGFLCGTGCLKIEVDNSIVEPKFLFFFLGLPSSAAWLEKHAVGSTMLNLNTGILGEIEVPLPPLSEQRRIVGILSAYDDLIENNRKRIALLEESARSLYKEWFVRLRFPGHERVPVEDGVPKGWKRATVGDVCEVLYGKAHADIPDGDIPIVGSGGVMRKGDKALCTESSVLIPRKGSLGNVMLMEEPFWVVDTMFYTRMKHPNTVRWLYYSIQDMKLEERATGTAIPSMTTAILNPLPLRLPSAEVLSKFSDWTNPLFSQIKTLRRESEKLAAARDALLPRLFNSTMQKVKK